MGREFDQLLEVYQSTRPQASVRGDVWNVGSYLNDKVKEIEAIIKSDGINCIKEFTYDGEGNIVIQSIFSLDGVTRLFLITYEYTGDDLTLITVLRDLDSYTYTKTLEYDVEGNLTSITIQTT